MCEFSPEVPTERPTETALVQDWFLRRDARALGQLLMRHSPSVLRYVRARQAHELRAKADAADLLQDATVALMRYHPPFVVATGAQFRGLLRSIVDTLLLAQHRFFHRRRRDVARERALPDDGADPMALPRARDRSPSSFMRGAEVAAELRRVVAGLDPVDQRILALRTEQQLDFPAIGELTGMRADTARVRCCRALAKLAIRLHEPELG